MIATKNQQSSGSIDTQRSDDLQAHVDRVQGPAQDDLLAYAPVVSSHGLAAHQTGGPHPLEFVHRRRSDSPVGPDYVDVVRVHRQVRKLILPAAILPSEPGLRRDCLNMRESRDLAAIRLG